MKMYWGSGGIAPRILDLGAGWRWVISFTPRPLYRRRRNPPYPLDRRLCGPQLDAMAKRKINSPCRESKPVRPAHSLVAKQAPHFQYAKNTEQPICNIPTVNYLHHHHLDGFVVMYEGVSKSFRTESTTKYKLTTIKTRW